MFYETAEFREWHSTSWNATLYEPDQICYKSSAANDNKVLLIRQGIVLVQATNRQGEKVNTEILVEGDLLNLEALVDDSYTWEIPHFIQYQVVAVTPVKIYEIEKEFLLSHLYVEPRKYHHLFERTIVQLAHISLSNFISIKNSQLKVAWALFRVIGKVGEVSDLDPELVFIPPFVTQTFIAQLANSGKARTNEAIKELLGLGIVAHWKPKCRLIHVGNLTNYLKQEISDQ
ncbi:Crp/Fnr family transcriptional regulator [Listeria valentina]|uniref:Crp/Fnr family transcriptional regulator n=1 Tax=Listeria valentina TaxID=2705293 RepID=UPI00142FB179|nr:Crp/Fnr family transcriptional regulator [Listeria valentina]